MFGQSFRRTDFAQSCIRKDISLAIKLGIVLYSKRPPKEIHRKEMKHVYESDVGVGIRISCVAMEQVLACLTQCSRVIYFLLLLTLSCLDSLTVAIHIRTNFIRPCQYSTFAIFICS